MYEMIKELIKPELLVLIPVLYLLGNAFKDSEIPNKYIPLILGITSSLLCTMFLAATSSLVGWKDVFVVVFSGITQGILCAGASVYVNQLIKQSSKDE